MKAAEYLKKYQTRSNEDWMNKKVEVLVFLMEDYHREKLSKLKKKIEGKIKEEAIPDKPVANELSQSPYKWMLKQLDK